MSRVIGHPQPYTSAYYRPAVDRGEYTLHSPGNYMAFPVYPPQHHVHPSHLPYPPNGALPNGMGTTTTVYPSQRSRSKSINNNNQASRSSSRSRAEGSNGGSSHGHSMSDFFSLRRSRSQDSRKSAKSARSGISARSLGEAVGEVFEHMMSPFRRSKSRDRVYTRGEYMQESEGEGWYAPSRGGAGKRLQKSQSTRRPARVPTYESAPAPNLHRSHTTTAIPHHILHQERHRERERDRRGGDVGEVEREGRSRSRPRAFTQAELEDQASTRRGLQDWIEGRMQDKEHSRDRKEQHARGDTRMQAFQPTWRASKDYRQNNHTTSLGGVPVSRPLAPTSTSKSGSNSGKGVGASAAGPKPSYTTTYTYNGYRVRV